MATYVPGQIPFGANLSEAYYYTDGFGFTSQIDIEFSREGETLLKNAGIYCLDDAVEKFIDEIDRTNAKIDEIYRKFSEYHLKQLENPLSEDFEKEYQSLYWSLLIKKELRDNLTKDLESLLGRSVPFDEWCDQDGQSLDVDLPYEDGQV